MTDEELKERDMEIGYYYENFDFQTMVEMYIKLEERLKIEQDCVDFYADRENWSYYDIHSWSSGDSTPRGDTECLEGWGEKGSKSYGGKKARETQATRNKNYEVLNEKYKSYKKFGKNWNDDE